MGMKHAQRYCPTCDDYVLAVGDTPNHILHLLLTIFTSGLWVIVWIWVSLGFTNWKCPKDGSTVYLNKDLAKLGFIFENIREWIGVLILALTGAGLLAATGLAIYLQKYKEAATALGIAGLFLGGAWWLCPARR